MLKDATISECSTYLLIPGQPARCNHHDKCMSWSRQPGQTIGDGGMLLKSMQQLSIVHNDHCQSRMDPTGAIEHELWKMMTQTNLVEQPLSCSCVCLSKGGSMSLGAFSLSFSAAAHGKAKLPAHAEEQVRIPIEIASTPAHNARIVWVNTEGISRWPHVVLARVLAITVSSGE